MYKDKNIHIQIFSSYFRSDQDVNRFLNVMRLMSRHFFFYRQHIFTLRCFNTLRPRQNGPSFADDTLKRIFLNENVRISIKISLKFVPKGPINNIPALVQIMAWRRSGNKPLFEPMMVSLLMQICITPPQWVKRNKKNYGIIYSHMVTRVWQGKKSITDGIIKRIHTAVYLPIQAFIGAMGFNKHHT